MSEGHVKSSGLRRRAWVRAAGACLRRLLADRAGNTLAMIAAALVPLLAMTGGAIDMGRSYLAQTRLQQACDAGVLAARKRLGTSPAAGGVIPADVAEVGSKFFNVNFRDGAYGTTDRAFDLILEDSFAMTGEASVKVPTTIMTIFGYTTVDVAVTCGAQVGMANTDVMLVLDVTGSMNQTNSGDNQPRIVELKESVRTFHAQLEAAKAPDARVRYGFVPYATNVNAAGLLQNDWVATSWDYQSRRLVGTGNAAGTTTYWAVGSVISGTNDHSISATYPAINLGLGPTCNAPPANTLAFTWVAGATTTEPYPGPPAGTLTRTNYRYTYNGDEFTVELNGSTCEVHRQHKVNYVVSYDRITQPTLANSSRWQYAQRNYDVSNWRTEAIGCMEEPDTYAIDDYDDVDFSQAKDLDLDHVPVAGDSTGLWRPMYPKYIYGRAKRWNNTGLFNLTTTTTTDEYYTPSIGDTAHCPNPARPLQEMSATDVDSYLATLKVGGSTYHDIGMLWGARMIVPTGLFAAANADESANQPTARHMVFMTDGQTSTLDLSYSAYGFEPLDQRRWSPGSARTLTETVEDRFAFICSELKKRNVTVWVVAFGTELNPVMEQCAGPGHAFQADDADELNDAFTTMAGSIASLRLVN